jgi:hypothetical protein
MLLTRGMITFRDIVVAAFCVETVDVADVEMYLVCLLVYELIIMFVLWTGITTVCMTSPNSLDSCILHH